MTESKHKTARRALPLMWLISHIREVRLNYRNNLRLKQKWPDCTLLGDCSVADSVRMGSGCVLNRADLRGSVQVGSNTLLNRKCRISGVESAPITIGNYCSIAQRVVMITTNHPLEAISTFQTGHSKLREVFQHQDKNAKPIEIGSDVWIGSNAIILSGVSIGHGAVIGAGAIVTKDVTPYSIAVGCPAKSVRSRFSDEKISLLLESQWWDWPESRIRENAEWFSSNFASLPIEQARNFHQRVSSTDA